jgi:hypothetical protein
MTQEKKDILIKDLNARLPYGVMLETDNVFPQKLEGITFDKDTFLISVSDGAFTLDWMTFRPYLYPLSSMTEKQKEEHQDLINNHYNFDANGNVFTLQDFYCKYHLDYRGLIPMRLAIDCTNLNIY